MKQTAIRLPEYQFVGLREVAQREGRNVSAVIRLAVRLYLEVYAEEHTDSSEGAPHGRNHPDHGKASAAAQ